MDYQVSDEVQVHRCLGSEINQSFKLQEAKLEKGNPVGDYIMGRFLLARGIHPGIIAFMVIIVACSGPAGPPGPSGEQGPSGPPGLAVPAQSPSKVFHAAGSNAWIAGGYGDNLVFTGENYNKTDGFITIDVNDETNEGMLVAQWEVEDWKYDASAPRAKGTMKVVWTDFFGEADFMDGGIVSNLVLHGDTGKEAPVLPTLFSHSSGWGSADVYLNDEMIYDDIVAHYMVHDSTRDPVTNAVHTRDGVGIFVPALKGGDAGDGFTYPDRILTTLIVHTDVKDPNNLPPFTMFMRIHFQNMSISTVSRP